MTDKLTSSELVEKAFFYITALAREGRKALTTKFEREHKGIPFDAVDSVMRKEVESWFAARDRNIKLNHVKSTSGKKGEIQITYLGASKDAHFKIQISGLFTVVESSGENSSYLKSVSINVDKRDFTK